MQLSFLIERRYAPYVKWFGTAFTKLNIADRLSAPLDSALHARGWREREKALGIGYEIVASAFNDLEIAPRLTLEPVRLWGRPFTVMWADFPGALTASVSLPGRRHPGSAQEADVGFISLRELIVLCSDVTATRMRSRSVARGIDRSASARAVAVA
jgi:hypothetical protein